MPGSEPHFEDVIIEVADELGLPADEVGMFHVMLFKTNLQTC